MLNNVVNNTLRSILILTSMATKSLSIPPGSLVAGSDLMFWNKTVLKRSGPGVITGDVTFLGQFDSASDIRCYTLSLTTAANYCCVFILTLYNFIFYIIILLSL